MQIEFDEKEEVLFEEIFTLYPKIKELMVYVEELEDIPFSPAKEELRHAFDHLMRVFAFKLGFKSADAKYAIENLNLAYNHLYRSAFNLLDYLSIYFRDKFRDELKGFSGKTLEWIFPKYYKEIKPYFEVEAPAEISKLRSEKVIGKRNYKNDLNKYTEIVERFKSYHEEILQIKPRLVEYENETRHGRSKLWQIIIGILSTIIGTILLKTFGLL
jgi:hypothetical protein